MGDYRVKYKIRMILVLSIVVFSSFILAEVKTDQDKATLSWVLYPLSYSDTGDYFWAISHTNLIRLCRFTENSPGQELMECSKSTQIASPGVSVFAWALPARLYRQGFDINRATKRILLQIVHPKNRTSYRNCSFYKADIHSNMRPTCSSSQFMPTL